MVSTISYFKSVLLGLSLTNVLLVSVTVFIVRTCFLSFKKERLPPGPWMQLPYFGYSLSIVYGSFYKGVPLYKFLMKFGQKYGKVSSFRALGIPFIVLNDYQAIREAFQDTKLNDRGENELQIKFFSKTYNKWNDIAPFRNFVLARFRQFGIGTSRVEESISKESQSLVEQLGSHNGEPVDLPWYLHAAVTNIICKVLFGTRFELSNQRVHRLTDLLIQHTKLKGSGGLELFMPIKVPSRAKQELRKNADESLEFINSMIESHLLSFDPYNLNDITDMWLNELQLHKSDDPSSFRHPDNMPGLIFLLFLAGTNSTATTLEWGIHYMVRYPEVQKRVQEEIDQVIGGDRLPRLADKPNLPFTEAVIAELHRHVSMLPLSAFHVAGNATQFRGYTIPKNSVVISNMYVVMHDPDVWGDPEAFRPERFLDAHGNFHEPKNVIPFGVGRRVCLGEALARQDLFVFFTHLLHQFTFKKTSDDAPMPSLTLMDGIALRPQLYKPRCIKRDDTEC